MYRILPRKIAVPTACAAAVTLLIALVPILVAARAEFLGKDVSGLATSIVASYPSYFVKEFAQVLVATFLCLLPGSFLFYSAHKALGARSSLAWILFPGGVVVFYGLLLLQSIYHYPALYDTLLSPLLETFVFRSAHVLSPQAFQLAAGLLLVIPFSIAFWRVPASRPAFAIAAAVSISACGTFYLVTSNGKLNAAAKQTQGRPNILLISIDSLRRDYTAEAMPAVELLRADPSTFSFEQHYVGVPRTFPSWVELLYGRYAPTNGVRHMFPGFGDRRQLTKPFPQILAEHGYQTSVISDFAGDIFPRFGGGFEKVMAPSMNLRGLIELAVHQKFFLFLPIATSDLFSYWFPSLAQNPAFADARRLERKFERSVTHEKPWFTTIFFSTAHFPYAVPYPFYRMYTDPAYPGPFFFQKNPEIMGEESVDDANVAQTRALYKGALTAVDQSLARIFDQLRAAGLWDRTIVIVTGDHGEDLYEHGRLQGHGEHLEGQNVLRVPLLIRVPQANFSERTSNFVSRSIDIGPTLLGLLGLPWNQIQGVSFDRWLTGSESAPPQLTAYSETGIWFSAAGKGEFQKERLAYPGISGLLSFDHGMSQEIVLNPNYEKLIASAKHRSIVSGHFKLIYMPSEAGVSFRLFDEVMDPDNLTDLSRSMPDKLEEMKKLLFDTVSRIEPRTRRVGDYFVRP